MVMEAIKISLLEIASDQNLVKKKNRSLIYQNIHIKKVTMHLILKLYNK